MMKNIKWTTFLAAFSLLTAGCAQKVWVNPNVTEQQFNKDFAECQYGTVKHGHVKMLGGRVGANMKEDMRKNEIMSSCMNSKGYRLEALPNNKHKK